MKKYMPILRSLLIYGGIVMCSYLLSENLLRSDSVTIEVYDEQLKSKEYKMHKSMIEDYNSIKKQLHILSYKHGFFTVREFMPSHPQYKVFVIYFKNGEALSISLEPVGNEYVYVCKSGRIDSTGAFISNSELYYSFSKQESSILTGVLMKFLFGRVPINITLEGSDE